MTKEFIPYEEAELECLKKLIHIVKETQQLNKTQCTISFPIM
jgi:hypothetical protein